MAGHSETRTGAAARSSGRSGFASGWTAFAGVMMIFGGIMTLFAGISAIAHDNVFVTTGDYVFKFDLTGWGWIHLILGVVILLAGFALFQGAMWARVVGVLLVGLGMVSNFLWLPWYPLWAIVLIAIDAFIIWALCVGSGRSEA